MVQADQRSYHQRINLKASPTHNQERHLNVKDVDLVADVVLTWPLTCFI